MAFKKVEFDGHEAIEVKTQGLRMVIVTDVGPRIAWLSLPDGENLLFWDYERALSRGEWSLRGGHRVWCATSLADESEDTYAPDNGPCTVAESADSITFTGALNEGNRTRRGITVTVVDAETVSVENFVATVTVTPSSSAVPAATFAATTVSEAHRVVSTPVPPGRICADVSNVPKSSPVSVTEDAPVAGAFPPLSRYTPATPSCGDVKRLSAAMS